MQEGCIDRNVHMTWTYPYLDLVEVFEIKCESSPGSGFDISRNTTTENCVDSVCHFSSEVRFNPGTNVVCGVRALVSHVGWTEEQVKMVFVLGQPSPPRSVDIRHQASLVSSTTSWSFTWADPTDYGDGSKSGDLDRALIKSYTAEISCATQKHEFLLIGEVLALNLQARWLSDSGELDSVAKRFEMVSEGEQQSSSLSCSRGDDVSIRVRTETASCIGEWSSTASLRAIGFPGKVCELRSSELHAIVRVNWMPPTEMGYGKSDETVPIGFKIESSLCKDFDRVQESCYYFSSVLPAEIGEQEREFTIKKVNLPVSGTSYWIRVTAQNEIGFGVAGCSILQDFMILPIILSPSRFPVWISNGQDCMDNNYSHVWLEETYSQSLMIKTWGLPSGTAGTYLECTIEFEDGDQLDTVAHRGATVAKITTLKFTFPSKECHESCRGSVVCTADSKSIEFAVIYFSYSRPSVLSFFPTDGPVTVGSEVKVLISDYSGPRTKYSAGLPDNLITAYSDPSSYSIVLQCSSDGGNGINVNALLELSGEDSPVLASSGATLFDLTIQIPPSPCGEGLVNLTLRFCSGDIVLPEFRYVGAKVCSVDPPAAMINVGTGGANLTVVLCNIESDCSSAVTAMLKEHVCTVQNTHYDVDFQTLTIQMTIPELERSLAGMLDLRFDGCNSQGLFSEWEYLPPPSLKFNTRCKNVSRLKHRISS